jgi:iron(III) transport system ATP-binding protein
MITINNLSINYGHTTVVDNLNLTLASDEILMLVGPTGCGKSTILKALAGLIPIAEGEICHQNWLASVKQLRQKNAMWVWFFKILLYFRI